METDLKIRMAAPEDAEELLAIYTPYVQNTAITFEYEVPDEKEFAGRIEKTQMRYPYFVAEMDGGILGYAYAGPFKERRAYDWAVETSIYVRQDRRGQGIGRKLHDALEETLKKQNILNMNACIAYPPQEDEYLTRASVRFHERMGYRMAGHFSGCGYKFNRWYDMVWMEKIIGEHRENQPEVLPVWKVQGNGYGCGIRRG